MPLSATRKSARSRYAARATWLSGFLIACASSSTTVSHSLAAETAGVEAQQGVGRERDVGRLVERAARAVVDGDLQRRAEALNLRLPVGEHARGRDDERARPPCARR